MAIHVDIVSAEGAIFSGDADMVFAPAKMGEVGIAPRHAPLLTTLRPGAIRVQTGEGAKALEARERAREALAGKHGQVDLTAAQAALVEAEARYRASQQLKGHSG